MAGGRSFDIEVWHTCTVCCIKYIQSNISRMHSMFKQIIMLLPKHLRWTSYGKLGRGSAEPLHHQQKLKETVYKLEIFYIFSLLLLMMKMENMTSWIHLLTYSPFSFIKRRFNIVDIGLLCIFLKIIKEAEKQHQYDTDSCCDVVLDLQ